MQTQPISEQPAMNQAEIEARLESVEEQLGQLQRQQEGVGRHLLRSGFVGLGFGLLFAFVAVIFSVIAVWRDVPNPSTPFVVAMIPLVLLGFGFVVAGNKSYKS